MNTKSTYYQQAYKDLGLVNKQPTPSQIVRTAENNIVKNTVVEPQNKQKKNNIYNSYSAEVQRQNDLFREQQKQRQAQMDATINANNAAADNSLKEAYTSYMLSQRNLPQQLRAYGISGGGSETVHSDIKNSYTDSRNRIETARDNANALARQNYNSGINTDYQKYLSNMQKVNSSYTKKLAGAESNVSGMRIGNDSTVYTSGQQILQALKDMGFTRQQAINYARQYGVEVEE